MSKIALLTGKNQSNSACYNHFMGLLEIDFAGVHFKNPVVAASGTFGNALEYQRFFDVKRLGGVSLKALTLNPRSGHAHPRVCETEAGMLNTIGLQNRGWDYFLRSIYPSVEAIDTNVIVNVAGSRERDYVGLVKRLSDLEAVAIIELNVSCPNIDGGEIPFGLDSRILGRLVERCASHSSKPLMPKLSPHVASMTEAAKACESAGAAALSLVNTFLGMKIDPATRTALIAGGMGGYSGPGIKPIALRMVYEVARSVAIPVMGIGGIRSADDAVEFLLAGASLVGVGTANLIDPKASWSIVKGLKKYCRRHRTDLRSLRGQVNVPPLLSPEAEKPL